MSNPGNFRIRLRRRRRTEAPLRRLDIHRYRRAFSLIEVVMALGIITFTLVGLMGLLSSGLQNFASAIDNTVATQIARGVIGGAQQAGFDDLSNLGGSDNKFYFDEQGNSREHDGADVIYTAVLRVDYGTGSERLADSANLARVQVDVTRISAPNQKKLYSAFIANNGG